MNCAECRENLVACVEGLLDREEFHVLLLSTKNALLKSCPVSRGSLNASVGEPREVFKDAITASAAGMILVHNHPSGDPTPSSEDIAITKRLVNASFETDLAHSLELEGHFQTLATASPDLVEGMAAFREKRDAQFSGGRRRRRLPEYAGSKKAAPGDDQRPDRGEANELTSGRSVRHAMILPEHGHAASA